MDACYLKVRCRDGGYLLGGGHLVAHSGHSIHARTTRSPLCGSLELTAFPHCEHLIDTSLVITLKHTA